MYEMTTAQLSFLENAPTDHINHVAFQLSEKAKNCSICL